MKNKRLNKGFNFAHKIYATETIQKYQKKIDLLGYKDTYDAVIFLNIRLLSTILIFFVVLYIFELGYIMAPIISVLYFYALPKIMIDRKIAERSDRLDNDAMYFFEVLTLSLETGRNLKVALEITANSIDSELSMEFRQALKEVRYGKSLNEALENQLMSLEDELIELLEKYYQ